MEIYEYERCMTDNGGWSALYFSTKNGNYKLVSFFACHGTDINFKTNIDLHYLHIAAYSGHLNLGRKLIEMYKFDVHATDESGCAATHHSERGGSYKLVTCFTSLGTNQCPSQNKQWLELPTYWSRL